jgi:ATP-dependent Clp protease ATP-binding subunit ClpA
MEKFTQRAQRVLSFAQEEAERMQHGYIGTEHMLIGLMCEEGGVAGRVLRDLGLNQRSVRELVERMTRAEQRSQTEPLVLSADIKKALELAFDEARRMGHHYLGTEHLLLALVRPAQGVAVDVLRRLNVNPEEVRRQTRRVLAESPITSHTAPLVARSNVPSLDELNERTLLPALHEATARGHRFTGTLHILLVMVQHEGAAQRILREMGLDVQRLETLLGKPTQSPSEAESSFAYSVNHDLGRAVNLASAVNDNIVRDKHLLLALAEHHQDMFEILNVDPGRLRAELDKHLNTKQ